LQGNKIFRIRNWCLKCKKTIQTNKRACQKKTRRRQGKEGGRTDLLTSFLKLSSKGELINYQINLYSSKRNMRMRSHGGKL